MQSEVQLIVQLELTGQISTVIRLIAKISQYQPIKWSVQYITLVGNYKKTKKTTSDTSL